VLSLSLATASATWRRPAQRVSFIFGDGQRNLATTGSSFIFDSGGQCKCDNVNPGDKVEIVLVKRDFTLSSSKLSEDRHMPCVITSL